MEASWIDALASVRRRIEVEAVASGDDPCRADYYRDGLRTIASVEYQVGAGSDAMVRKVLPDMLQFCRTLDVDIPEVAVLESCLR